MKILNEVENILKLAGIEEYKAETRLIFSVLSDISIERILTGENPKNQQKIINIAKQRAETKRPIQHLLGFSYFMGEKYAVNEHVLIPREETEFLVNEGYELIKNKTEKIDILDIGVGSGCISCSLAKKIQNQNIEILGIDVSFEAIETALINIDRLNLIRKVILRKSDLYSKIRENEKFDLIISNPPYIPISQKEFLQTEVRDFEPEGALFAKDELGIEFYQKIIEQAPKYLKKNGCIAFELGINQTHAVKRLLERDFSKINIIKDLANIERVISAKLK